MRAAHLHPGALRALLAGASLAILAQAAPSLAQDATPPRPRANNPANQTAQGSVQLEELSVTGQGGGPVVAGPVREDPRGPITGFVAKRSLTATKTDTPLIETPQSITVIGRQQLD
ncbi:MAG: TonB-dependent siderophore receptor, partial [Actinomycetospora chiangmaiensis]|nr:TonB-dependent siderophore receptor [Actinomycetospora chiangmaiensis]